MIFAALNITIAMYNCMLRIVSWAFTFLFWRVPSPVCECLSIVICIIFRGVGSSFPRRGGPFNPFHDEDYNLVLSKVRFLMAMGIFSSLFYVMFITAVEKKIEDRKVKVGDLMEQSALRS